MAVLEHSEQTPKVDFLEFVTKRQGVKSITVDPKERALIGIWLPNVLLELGGSKVSSVQQAGFVVTIQCKYYK